MSPHPSYAGRVHASLSSLATLIRNGSRVVALTGAGVSTESGIPDYRSPESLARPRKPIQGPEFVRSLAVRQRYWARAMVGWDRFSHAKPGPAHVALARLESAGVVRGLITQNVDRLHHAAGSVRITELHGALAEVVCLDCHAMEERAAVQARLRSLNANWSEARRAREPISESGGVRLEEATRMAPDGDADIEDERIAEFTVPPCLACGGVLKPNVVFFGHNVAKPIVEEAYARVDAADLLLIAGTSLTVFSGYRFLLRAADRGIPIAIINRGPVRGEERATLVIEGSTGEALSDLAKALT